MSDDVGEHTAREARLLLRAARSGTLATGSDGQPFASLITPCVAPDGALMMLLSDLSEHTRQLRRDGRCAVMVCGSADGPNAQTAPRVTVTGIAAIDDDPALRARWVAVHPYAAFYAGFSDFNVWRVDPGGALFVGGFARAHRLRRTALMAEPAACAAVLEAEAGIIAHCNRDHGDALDAIAGAGETGWTMAACDVEGCDLVRAEEVRRIAWPAPVDGPGGVRKALVHLAGAARQGPVTSAGPEVVGPL